MITLGVVYKTYMDSNGNAKCSVQDQSGTCYSSVPFAGDSGGTFDNFSHNPVVASGDMSRMDEDNFKGSYVLLLHINTDVPVIIGKVPAPLREAREKPFFLTGEGGEFDSDQKQAVDKAHIKDEYRKIEGSVRTMGSDGITLDTQANSKPIRIQTSSTSHVRVSQSGQSTTDHVVLSSVLMTKLSELEAVVAALTVQVNTLTGSLSGALVSIEAISSGTVLTSTGLQQRILSGGLPIPAPSASPPANPLTAWTKGLDATYQADCIRISNKPVG